MSTPPTATSYPKSTASPPSFSPSSPQAQPSTQKPPLALPSTPHNPSQTTKLDMSSGSTTVKLDSLGPMVVSKEGTLGRIANWEGMTEGERENTLRIIGKRNRERLADLRAREGIEDGDGGEGGK